MKVDLKTILTILGVVVSLAGFYYQTQMRLDTLEAEITSLKIADKQMRKLIRRGNVKPK
jgi:hypothetical protein